MRGVLAYLLLAPVVHAQTLDADLLVVGGTEAGVTAAVQAARLGVERVVLVNDIEWLGGQFSAEAVGALDEWTIVRGKRANFPRSGQYLEIVRAIRAHNAAKYGLPAPGNAVCASETIEPQAAARLFAAHLAAAGPRVRYFWPYVPTQVQRTGNRVTGVTFTAPNQPPLTVRAKLTIDASDWGEVIRLSGAKYAAGPDVRGRFNEEHAPVGPLGADRNEMNPLSYCLVLRESAQATPVPAPPGYDERAFWGTTAVTGQEFARLGWPQGTGRVGLPAFVDTAYPEGIYSAHSSAYTHRRLVDRIHNRLPTGTECVLLNWPVQDYPLYQFPQRVQEALEANEVGASSKNIVEMTPAQRQMVFADAKLHALGMLHHLQTTIHTRLGAPLVGFRQLVLTDEFGTPDRLPFKPYVREGLRLEALYMVREHDVRTPSDQPGWAKVMVPDSVFGWQFNLDFHPTRRTFLNGDPAGPWAFLHTANRNWSLHTDRAGFPLRGLIPVEMDGLLGASKNIGLSSIVSSALRLHGQMMHTGQAAGTLATLCLRHEWSPRSVASDFGRVRAVQTLLIRGAGGSPGVLLWPYHDLSPDEPWFEAANQLAIRAILPGRPGQLDFAGWEVVSRRELARTLARAVRAGATAPDWHRLAQPRFTDVPATDTDRVLIESLCAWMNLGAERFEPHTLADWQTLHRWLTALKWPASPGLLRQGHLPLTRGELARHVWATLVERPSYEPPSAKVFAPGHDADDDGRPDLDDPLPFDRNNDGIPDRLDPTAH